MVRHILPFDGRRELFIKWVSIQNWYYSIPWEIGNALSAMFKRKRITLEQAKIALQLYRKIPITFVDVQLESAVEITKQLNIYAYDAYLITCALQR
jgi:predicted nucleic acid-binding protein